MQRTFPFVRTGTFFLRVGATKAKDEPFIEEDDAAMATPTVPVRSMLAMVMVIIKRKECARRFSEISLR